MYSAQSLTDKGMPIDKIVIGLPTYGRTWNLYATGIPPPNTPAEGSDSVR